LSPRSFRLAVGLETALAAALGFLFLGSKSFSNDEGVTIVMARLPWSGLSHLIATRETNGAFYFSAIHFLTHGDGGEIGLRMPSVLFATAAVPVLAVLTRRLFDPVVAVVAALLLALDPLQVEYAQVAREYVLAVLLVIVSTYAFVRGVQDRSTWPWVVYAVSSALAVYTFLFAGVVPLMHALSLAALPRERASWRKFGLGAAGAALLVVPMAILLSRSGASSGVNWAAGNLPGRIVVSIRSAAPKALVDAIVIVVVLALAAVVVHTLERNARRPWLWPAALLSLWALGSFVLVAAAGFILQPLFVVRYFLIFAPPVAIAVALALVRIPARAAAVVAAAAVVVAGLGLARWYRSTGADFRAASAYVADGARADDGVLFYAPYVRIPFEVYFPASSPATPVYPGISWRRDPARFIEYVPMRKAAVAEALVPYRRVWLVLSQYQLYGNRDVGYDHVVAALAARGFRLEGERTFAGVNVRSYVRE
jgi:4-amino-4-deoxy-L-arabinose transferase-like glycosyltransferase